MPARDSLIKATVVRSGRYSSVLYTTGDGLPLTKKGIEQRVLLYPASAQQYMHYKASKRNTLLFGVGALSSLVVARMVAKQPEVGTPSKVFIGIGISGLLLELISAVHTSLFWHRSIEVYNQHFKS
jgi:hypothetical protein